MSSGLDIRQFTTFANNQQEWSLDGYLGHWSPTSLAMLRECPREFQERYLKGRKKRPAESPLIGTAVHKGLERNFRQKIETEIDLPTVDVVEWFDDEGFRDVVSSEQEHAGLEVEWDTSPEEAMTRGRKMLGAYMNTVASRIQPVAVEGSFSVDMGLPVPIVGRYDLLRRESAIDWKSSKQKTTTPKTAWAIQAAVYSYATALPVEFHTLSCTLKEGKVSIVTPLESEALLLNPTATEIRAMQAMILAISDEASFYMRRFGPDQSWPTHGRFHMFACGYCSFRSDCPAWEHER